MVKELAKSHLCSMRLLPGPRDHKAISSLTPAPRCTVRPWGITTGTGFVITTGYRTRKVVISVKPKIAVLEPAIL